MSDTCPYLLPWTPTESARAHKAWKANCGPHAIAAALSVRLDAVREAIGVFKGYMNPTQVRDTLHALRVRVGLAGRVRVDWLCNGLNYIQWEGPWLERGVPAREAYKHTHWVAHWEGWVLCTAVNANSWLTVEEWKQRLHIQGDYWHVRAHYRLMAPPRSRGDSVPSPAREQNVFQFSEEFE